MPGVFPDYPAPVVRKIVHHRTKKRLGPVQIAPLVGVAPSTVHRVLVRCHLNRLAWLDRASGNPVRYEYPRPGGLVHVDVKKLGRSVLIGLLPMALLLAIQFNAAPDSFINRTAGLGETQQITAGAGKIRPPGTFSFVSGVIFYAAMSAAFSVCVRRRGVDGVRLAPARH